jgi:hypothetical protein
MKIYKIIFITLLLLSTRALADNGCGTAVGNVVMGKVTLQCQQITGNATLTGTTMTGKLTVLGGLTATRATLDSIDVTGNVTLDSSTVGPAKITGQLVASDSTFKDIAINSEDVELSHSTTGNIVISSSRANSSPILKLTKKCTVNGNITFTGSPGVEVNDSKITGKVIGGKVK